jgi:hypothetical protein
MLAEPAWISSLYGYQRWTAAVRTGKEKGSVAPHRVLVEWRGPLVLIAFQRLRIERDSRAGWSTVAIVTAYMN